MSLDPLLAFFALGVLARSIGSDLSVPAALSESLTLVLLLAIGLKGGAELASQPAGELALPMLTVVAMGVGLSLLAFVVLSRLVRLPRVDAASVAAHYGSVSVGTFAVATAADASAGLKVEPYLPLFVVLLEAPAIVVGVLLAHQGDRKRALRPVLREIFLGKSLVLLLGGTVIGVIAGKEGIAPIAPLFVSGFKAILALFLLEMGLVCANRLGALRQHGVRLALFAIGMPLVNAVIGVLLGRALGLSEGGTAMFAVLAASASYIAAPAAMRVAVPQANPTLSLAAALGVTFPFNVLIGIPLYAELARLVH